MISGGTIRALCICTTNLVAKKNIPYLSTMTERELLKLEGTIRQKMADIKSLKVSVKDSGIGVLLNSLKKVDEALYEKILPEYKILVARVNSIK